MINEIKGKKVRVIFENFYEGIMSIDAICLRASDGCIVLKDKKGIVHVFPFSKIFRVVEIENKN